MPPHTDMDVRSGPLLPPLERSNLPKSSIEEDEKQHPRSDVTTRRTSMSVNSQTPLAPISSSTAQQYGPMTPFSHVARSPVQEENGGLSYRRASGEHAFVSYPNERQSLPSLREALLSSQPLTFGKPASSLAHQAELASPTNIRNDTFYSESFRNSRAHDRPITALPRKPFMGEIAPISPPPQHHQPRQPDGGPMESMVAKDARDKSAQSTIRARSPGPQSVPAYTASDPWRNQYSHPPAPDAAPAPTPRVEHARVTYQPIVPPSAPPAGSPSYTATLGNGAGSNSFNASVDAESNWRSDRSELGEPTRRVSIPYGTSVKRHLDDFDLETSVNEIADVGRRLVDFGTYYSQKAHQTQRSGPLPGSTPDLKTIDDMLLHCHSGAEAFIRMREVVMAQQAALIERSREQAQKNAQQAAMETSVSEESRVGGFAGADAKKRRGRAAPPGRCHSCHRAETPEWRRGPDGARTLCNACGLHYAKLTRKLGAQATKNAMGSSSNLRPKSVGSGAISS